MYCVSLCCYWHWPWYWYWYWHVLMLVLVGSKVVIVMHNHRGCPCNCVMVIIKHIHRCISRIIAWLKFSASGQYFSNRPQATSSRLGISQAAQRTSMADLPIASRAIVYVRTAVDLRLHRRKALVAWRNLAHAQAARRPQRCAHRRSHGKQSGGRPYWYAALPGKYPVVITWPVADY